MLWNIKLSKEAAREFKKLPRDRQKNIARVIERMKADPFLGDTKPLQGKKWKGWYRTVVGRYRIIFIPRHQEHTVDIVRILPRSEKTYR
jgi:mRNA-degrading endonuclease RelE of RelBE toxin-antitoxin system